MAEAPSNFHVSLRKKRVEAGMTQEGMAILCGLPQDRYEAIEDGKYPEDETLKRLCTLMDWNYYDTKRLIVNEMIAPTRKGMAPATLAKKEPLAAAKEGLQPGAFAKRLKAAREEAGQNEEILAMLLNVDVETYREVEGGRAPSPDLLRRISLAFGWNYNDLLDMVRGEQASRLGMRHLAPVRGGGSANLPRFKKLVDEMEGALSRMKESDQEHILMQLELVRDTMRRLAAAPAKTQA